ncbi:MAG: hypothetical protein ACLFWR_02280 [Acidimicrobiales bacterium]
MSSADLCEALARLDRSRLTPAEWTRVSDALEHVCTDLEADRTDRLAAITAELSNTAFGAKVRTRIDRDRTPAPIVVPTKPSRALPAVGAICGLTLLALGWAMGGRVVLVGTAAFALFILVVAVAGTRSVAARRARARPASTQQAGEPVPGPVRSQMDRVRTILGCG